LVQAIKAVHHAIPSQIDLKAVGIELAVELQLTETFHQNLTVRFLLDQPEVSMIGSADKMLVSNLPRNAVGRSFLADPMEAVGGDLDETLSRFEALRILADLDNVLTLGSSNLATVVLAERVAPDNVPSADAKDRRYARSCHAWRTA
jgi:hypothetical protein